MSRKKIILLLSSIAVAFCLLISIAFYIAEKNAESLTASYLDDIFYTEYKFEKVNIRLLSTFPFGTIDIKDLVITESVQGSNKAVATIKHLKLQFNLFDIFLKTYIIHRIVIDGADVKLKVDSNGVSNFSVLKKKHERKEQTNIKLDLRKLILRNSNLSFYDANKKLTAKTNIDKATLSGLFSKDNFDVSTELFLKKMTVEARGINYIKNSDLTLKGDIGVDAVKGLINFKKGNTLNLLKVTFKVGGKLQYTEVGVGTNIYITSKEADIKTLVALLPSSYAKDFENYNSSGKISFITKVDGVFGRNNTPHISAEFLVDNGSLNNEENKVDLTHLNIRGKFNNGAGNSLETSEISLEKFEGTLNKKSFYGDMGLININQPDYHAHINGELDLKYLQSLIRNKEIEKISGNIIADITVKGKAKSIKKISIGFSAVGYLQLKNVFLQPAKYRLNYRGVNGKLIFNKDMINAENLSAKIGESDFLMSGSFRNLSEYFFDNTKKVEINATLFSNKVNLTQLGERAYRKRDSTYHVGFPSFIGKADINVKTKQFIFNRFHTSDIVGKVIIKGNHIYLSNFEMNTMKGRMLAEAHVEKVNDHLFNTTTSSTLKKIDIQDLFYQMGSFGQTFITEKNIAGIVDANVENLFIPWSDNLHVDLTKVSAKIDLAIDNGELINFKPVAKLGKYLNLEKFEHLYFSHLQNSFTIKDNVINIPEMELKSNVMNMSAYGTHTLNNIIDYHIKLNASQVLLGKKDDDINFPNVTTDESGGLIVYLRMYGHANKPFIDADAKGLGNRILKELKFHYKTLRSFLFGDKTEPKKENETIVK
ncbi:MAG: AsmA family protein [Bacteroidetes bacterium]|nr:AsmA family protein [Bacteroidota bacterium]